MRSSAKEPPPRWRRPWRRSESNFERYWEVQRPKQRSANYRWGFNRSHQQWNGSGFSRQWQQGAVQGYGRYGENGGQIRGSYDQKRKQQSYVLKGTTFHNRGAFIPNSEQQHNPRLQATGPAIHKTKQQGESFAVFVDGLGDRITLQKLRAIFGKAGRLHDVFIQQKKKYLRRFRFGFIRFKSDDEAWKAIRMFHGLKLEGNYLVVQKARFQRPSRSFVVPSAGKNQYAIQGKVWRTKEQHKVSEQGPVPVKKLPLVQPADVIHRSDDCQLRLAVSDVDEEWFQSRAVYRQFEA